MATAAADVTATKPVASTFRRNGWTSPMESRKATASGTTEPSVSSRIRLHHGRAAGAHVDDRVVEVDAAQHRVGAAGKPTLRPADPGGDQAQAPVITGVRLGPPRLQYDSSWVMPVYEARSSDMAATAAATSGSSSSPVTGSTSRTRLGTPSSNVRTMTARNRTPRPPGGTNPRRPSRRARHHPGTRRRSRCRRGRSPRRLGTSLASAPLRRTGSALSRRRSVAVAGVENDRSIGSDWRTTARQPQRPAKHTAVSESLRGR